MSLLKPVTHEEAKRVWVSIPNPSARRVAKPLTQSGLTRTNCPRRGSRQDRRPADAERPALLVEACDFISRGFHSKAAKRNRLPSPWDLALYLPSKANTGRG